MRERKELYEELMILGKMGRIGELTGRPSKIEKNGKPHWIERPSKIEKNGKPHWIERPDMRELSART